MGGLRRAMPVTFWCMAVGLGALAGLPPLAGFWSKDGILLAAAEAVARHGPAPAWVGWLVWLAGLSASRSPPGTPPGCCCVTFFGDPRTPPRTTAREAAGR